MLREPFCRKRAVLQSPREPAPEAAKKGADPWSPGLSPLTGTVQPTILVELAGVNVADRIYLST